MTDLPGGETPHDDSHDDSGLDLAREVARATASSSRKATSRRRSSGQPADRRTQRTPRAAASGAHPDDRDPQPLEVSVGKVVADHGWDLELRVQGVFARWVELVGPEVGDHSTPESLTDGQLVVRTDSTAWATQLRLLAPTLVRRLNEELGDDTVRVVEVHGPQGPSWKKGRLSVRDGRGPRDTYG